MGHKARPVSLLCDALVTVKKKKSLFRRTCLSHSNQITTTALLQRNSFIKADSSPEGHWAIAISIGPPVGACKSRRSFADQSATPAKAGRATLHPSIPTKASAAYPRSNSRPQANKERPAPSGDDRRITKHPVPPDLRDLSLPAFFQIPFFTIKPWRRYRTPFDEYPRVKRFA